MDEFWNTLLADLQPSLPPQTYATWISPIRPVSLAGSSFTLEVPNKFFSDWIRENRLDELIGASFRRLTGLEPSLTFVPAKELKSFARRLPTPAEPAGVNSWQERAAALGLNPKYTFDSFVVGSSNQFAHAASHAVAEKSPRTYNPLFIYGGVGLGKTHLLNAIGNHKIENYPEAKVCYVHSENFMNELIQAIASKRMPEFREKYRRMDILLIDDIQFIAGKERTQEEFFHTFNTLYESHKNIVVTSDRFPKEIPGIEDRLRSRFEWGLIADIQAPDLETKVAILQKKAEIESILLPNEVSHFLAANFSSNIRELEGSLVRIAAFSSLTHSAITIELAREVLKDFIKEKQRDVTVETILKAVSEHFGVTLADLKGKRRTRMLAHPRQIAMYLARELTNCSFPEIGQKIGNRDHSTVMYATSKVAASVTGDSELEQDIRSIRTALGR